MKITYSAPLSVPFCGENVALYGKPVLIAACDKKVTLALTDGIDNETDSFLQFIDKAVNFYLEKRKIKYKKSQYSVNITCDISALDSMSYKSAVIVAATAALLEFYTEKKPSLEEINVLSYQIHKSFFKLSLGFFTSCSCFGGIQYYRKEFEFLKSLSKLNFKLPESIQSNLYISSSHITISPREAMESIKKIYNEDPQVTEKIFSDLEKMTKRLVVAIAQESNTVFTQTLAKAHELNKKLGGKGLSEDFALLYSSQKEKLIQFKLSENGIDRH